MQATKHTDFQGMRFVINSSLSSTFVVAAEMEPKWSESPGWWVTYEDVTGYRGQEDHPEWHGWLGGETLAAGVNHGEGFCKYIGPTAEIEF